MLDNNELFWIERDFKEDGAGEIFEEILHKLLKIKHNKKLF